MKVEKFKLPKDLSELPAPIPVEAVDEDMDAIAAYLNDVVHSELEGLHKLVAEQAEEIRRLKEPLT